MLTSVVKRIDVAVYDLISAANSGSRVSDKLGEEWGNTFGRRYGVVQGGVSLSRLGGHIEQFLAEIRNAENAIKSGQIVVPRKP
jgi:basic membrane lipoprotein Med (substrate-binding protein (PBP1-ABC) superfamily)